MPSCWTPWPRATYAPTRTPSCIAHRVRGRRRACSCPSPRYRTRRRQADRSAAAACAKRTGARGDGEITMARLAAPPWMGCRSRARVADRAAAAWTDWSAVGVGPAQAPEHVFDPAVGHAHDLGGTERARRSRKQEMLRHDHHGREDKSAPLLPGSPKKYNPESIGGASYIRPRIWAMPA